MHHQAQLVESAAEVTAPSCSPTSRASARPRRRCWRPQAANAFPLLVVVPNVVKMNWAREAGIWTPHRAAAGHADQRPQQGALVCQDWAGPRAGSIARGQYFAGADVPDDAEVAGMFAFVFACFGGGTPARDRFAHTPGEEPPKLAEAPFAAALPQRLLAHPGGGALGCIAHVERAWGDSIVESGAGPQLIPFENAIGNVLAGKPIGLALKDFNERFAALSVSLAGLLEQIGDGMIVPDRQLAKAWIQRNDAEGYALFGDPGRPRCASNSPRD